MLRTRGKRKPHVCTAGLRPGDRLASSGDLGRGLRWILLGLLLALSGAMLNVAVTLAFLTNASFSPDAPTRTTIALVSVAVPIAASIMAGLGLRPLYGRISGAGNGRPVAARAMRWSALAAGVSAITFVGTGLLLGWVLLGGDAHSLTRAAHTLAGLLFALTAGLLLLLAVREFGSWDTSFLAGGALSLGVLSAVMPVLGFDVGVPPYLIRLVSLVLWVLAYAGTIHFVGRGSAKGGQPVPVG